MMAWRGVDEIAYTAGTVPDPGELMRQTTAYGAQKL